MSADATTSQHGRQEPTEQPWRPETLLTFTTGVASGMVANLLGEELGKPVVAGVIVIVTLIAIAAAALRRTERPRRTRTVIAWASVTFALALAYLSVLWGPAALFAAGGCVIAALVIANERLRFARSMALALFALVPALFGLVILGSVVPGGGVWTVLIGCLIGGGFVLGALLMVMPRPPFLLAVVSQTSLLSGLVMFGVGALVEEGWSWASVALVAVAGVWLCVWIRRFWRDWRLARGDKEDEGEDDETLTDTEQIERFLDLLPSAQVIAQLRQGGLLESTLEQLLNAQGSSDVAQAEAAERILNRYTQP